MLLLRRHPHCLFGKTHSLDLVFCTSVWTCLTAGGAVLVVEAAVAKLDARLVRWKGWAGSRLEHVSPFHLHLAGWLAEHVSPLEQGGLLAGNGHSRNGVCACGPASAGETPVRTGTRESCTRPQRLPFTQLHNPVQPPFKGRTQWLVI